MNVGCLTLTCTSVTLIRFLNSESPIPRLYPFVPEKDFESWAPKLTAALSEFAPFELTFATVSSFSHGPSNTLFLQPDEAAKVVLKRIQARLEATVPICNDLSKIGAHGFTPHLTLGQWQGAASSKAAIANLNATWKPITFTVQVRTFFLL